MSGDIKERLQYVIGESSRNMAYDPIGVASPALARIEALEAENFKLAAGLCNHQYGDEYGNSHCRRIDELEAQLAAAREALRVSLTAMTLASGLEVISIEFEFRHAIDAVKAALGKDTQ